MHCFPSSSSSSSSSYSSPFTFITLLSLAATTVSSVTATGLADDSDGHGQGIVLARQLNKKQHQHNVHAPRMLHVPRHPTSPIMLDNDDHHNLVKRVLLYPRQSNAGGGNANDNEDGNDSNTPSTANTVPSNTAANTITRGGSGNNGNGQGGGGSSAPSSRTSNTVQQQQSQPSNTAQQSSTRNIIDTLQSGLSDVLNNDGSSSTSISDQAATSSITSAPTTINTIPTALTDTSISDVTDTDNIENTTVTQTVSAPTSVDSAALAAAASASAAAEAERQQQEEEKNKDKDSGISKSAIIIIIVVASCVGGAIAIWTIIRKVKLSPSSRFNRKLAPIDFSAGRRDSDYFGTLGSVDGHVNNDGEHSKGGGAMDKEAASIIGGEAWPLHRSPSQSSNGHGDYSNNHTRQDSNEKSSMGMYGAIVPSLPPSSSAGSIRRQQINGNGNGVNLNRADAVLSGHSHGHALSDGGHGDSNSIYGNAYQHQNFYPGLSPPQPSVTTGAPVPGSLYNMYATGAATPAPGYYAPQPHQQQYQHQQPQYHSASGLSNAGSMRRPQF